MDSDDDNSSILSESSLKSEEVDESSYSVVTSFYDQHKERLAQEVINLASDRFQGEAARAVNSGGSREGVLEIDLPRDRTGQLTRRASDRVPLLRSRSGEWNSAVVGESPGHQTTAIFNDSSDITVGNQTVINGSVTIRQIHEETEEIPEYSFSFWKESSLKKKIFIVSALTFAIIAIGAVIVYLTLIAEEPSNGTYRIVSRGEWVAQPPSRPAMNLKLPVNRVIIAHTATDNCSTTPECILRVRLIQAFHMESRNFSDIAYEWLVGGDGNIYEGRGWDKQGSHTGGFNVGSICIAFIGTFTNYAPTKRALEVSQLLLEDGMNKGKLTKEYKVFGQRQLIASESPGQKLYEIIKTWKHWSDVLKMK